MCYGFLLSKSHPTGQGDPDMVVSAITLYCLLKFYVLTYTEYPFYSVQTAPAVSESLSCRKGTSTGNSEIVYPTQFNLTLIQEPLSADIQLLNRPFTF
jgi:hypothetical protein